MQNTPIDDISDEQAATAVAAKKSDMDFDAKNLAKSLAITLGQETDKFTLRVMVTGLKYSEELIEKTSPKCLKGVFFSDHLLPIVLAPIIAFVTGRPDWNTYSLMKNFRPFFQKTFLKMGGDDMESITDNELLKFAKNVHKEAKNLRNWGQSVSAPFLGLGFLAFSLPVERFASIFHEICDCLIACDSCSPAITMAYENWAVKYMIDFLDGFYSASSKQFTDPKMAIFVRLFSLYNYLTKRTNEQENNPKKNKHHLDLRIADFKGLLQALKTKENLHKPFTTSAVKKSWSHVIRQRYLNLRGKLLKAIKDAGYDKTKEVLLLFESFLENRFNKLRKERHYICEYKVLKNLCNEKEMTTLSCRLDPLATTTASVEESAACNSCCFLQNVVTTKTSACEEEASNMGLLHQ